MHGEKLRSSVWLSSRSSYVEDYATHPDSPRQSPSTEGDGCFKKSMIQTPKIKSSKIQFLKNFSSKTNAKTKGSCQSLLLTKNSSTPLAVILRFCLNPWHGHKSLKQESTQGPLLTIKPTTLLFDWGQKLWLSEKVLKDRSKEKPFQSQNRFLSP